MAVLDRSILLKYTVKKKKNVTFRVVVLALRGFFTRGFFPPVEGAVFLERRREQPIPVLHLDDAFAHQRECGAAQSFHQVDDLRNAGVRHTGA